MVETIINVKNSFSGNITIVSIFVNIRSSSNENNYL